MSPTASRWVVAGLVAVFALKVTLALTLAPHPLLQPVGDLDAGVYWRLAERVAAGDLLLEGTPFFVSPLYIYWLALAQLLTGASVTGVLLLQAGLGTLAVWLAARTAARWVPAEARPRVALVAGGALALCGIVALQEALILQSALDALLMSSFAYASTRALQAQTVRAWLACGAALALLASNRPNAWLLALPMIVGVVRGTFAMPPPLGLTADTTGSRVAARTRARAMRVAALAVGVGLVLMPFAVRTQLATGAWEVLPGHGGLNVYIGNHPQANGTYTVIEGIRPSIEGQIHDAQVVVLREERRQVSPTQVSSHFTRRALAWWRDAPLAAARLLLYKLWLTTHSSELPVNASYAWFREQVWLLWLLPVGAWLLVPVGLATSLGINGARSTQHAERNGGGNAQRRTPNAEGLGAGNAERRMPSAEGWGAEASSGWRVFRWLLPVYLLSVALFFVVDRYRAPALVLGAIHLGVLVSLWPAPDRRGQARVTLFTGSRRGVAAGVCAVTLMLAGLVPLPFQLGEADADTQMALHAIEQGRDDEADEWMTRAVARHPAPGIAWFRAGLGWRAREEYTRAEGALREARRLDPDVADVTFALAGVLLAQGKGAEALPLLREVEGAETVVGTPRAWEPGVRLDVALAHWQAGDQHQARQTLRGGVPAAALPLLRARALAAVESRRVDVAEWLLEEYRRHAPLDAEVAEKLALMKARTGDVEQATTLLEDVIGLDPQRATARFNLAVIRARQGRRDDAIALLHEALRIDPAYAQAAGALQELSALR